ncbi:protein-tyrosine phosphatase-like protein [Mycena sp. CBHHK59/15]|nr:protein-tyrosine phosphatase-like protein [Mycena sp. CBHHK59/15]
MFIGGRLRDSSHNNVQKDRSLASVTLMSASPSNDILSSLPFTVVEGVFNIRDIGGFKTNNSLHVVKPGLLFRSGEISGITETGKEQLLALGIRRVFDLRTKMEIARYKTVAPDIPGVEFVHVTVGKEEPFESESIALLLKRYEENEHLAFVQDAQDTLEIAAPAFDAIFRHFLEKSNEPCLFHCTAGKDRTGLVACIILMLLGVDDTDIVNDYTLTTAGLEPANAALGARFQQIPVFRDNWKGVTNMGSSRPESMSGIIAMIREKYGGAAAYLTAHTSLKENDLDTVRHNLLAKKA